MSWSFRTRGPKEAVRAYVEKHTISDSSPDLEKVQYAKAKELIFLSLDGQETDWGRGEGFEIDASGYASWQDVEGKTKVTDNVISVKVNRFNVQV